MKLEVKGFTTKAELKKAVRDKERASIFLEPAPDGVHMAEPLKGKWQAMVFIYDGILRGVR